MPIIHCENSPITEHLIARYLASGSKNPMNHARSRPPVVEAEAVARMVSFAAAAESAMYVVHLSTQDGVEVLRQARARSLPCYAETCPHYLILTDEVYDQDEGYLWIMSPPLRKQADQESLWAALADGTVQVIATDEASWNRSLKLQDRDSFARVTNGIPGVETRLPIVYANGVHTGRLSIEQFADLTSTNPAKIFGLYPQKGVIAPGSDADLVIFDPNGQSVLSIDQLHGKADWCPFEGFPAVGCLKMTIARGEIVVDHGQLTGTRGRGRFVARRLSEATLRPETSDASSEKERSSAKGAVG